MKQILIVFLGLFIVGCDGHPSTKEVNVRTDIAPIRKRLLNLPEIVEVKWKSQMVGSNNGITVPGPSAYHIWGYARCNHEALLEIYTKAKGVSVEDGWTPAFPFREGQKENQWEFSKEFTDTIKPRMLVRSIWICPQESLIYFDLEGE